MEISKPEVQTGNESNVIVTDCNWLQLIVNEGEYFGIQTTNILQILKLVKIKI